MSYQGFMGFLGLKACYRTLGLEYASRRFRQYGEAVYTLHAIACQNPLNPQNP